MDASRGLLQEVTCALLTWLGIELCCRQEKYCNTTRHRRDWLDSRGFSGSNLVAGFLGTTRRQRLSAQDRLAVNNLAMDRVGTMTCPSDDVSRSNHRVRCSVDDQ
jgi:hypothetical protein